MVWKVSWLFDGHAGVVVVVVGVAQMMSPVELKPVTTSPDEHVCPAATLIPAGPVNPCGPVAPVAPCGPAGPLRPRGVPTKDLSVIH